MDKNYLIDYTESIDELPSETMQRQAQGSVPL